MTRKLAIRLLNELLNFSLAFSRNSIERNYRGRFVAVVSVVVVFVVE